MTGQDLVVILDTSAAIRLKDGTPTSLVSGADVTSLTKLLNSHQAVMRSLYGEDEDWSERPSSADESMMGAGQHLDLSLFYKVTCDQDRLEQLAEQLRQLRFVQSAYLKPPVELASVERTETIAGDKTVALRTHDFTKFQEYLNAAVAGIDARYAWTKRGGKGKNVRIIDVEGAWRFSHEDLLGNGGGCVGGVPISSFKWRTHGTAVLGILGGDHNGFGITGICPAADVNTISVFGNVTGEPSADWGSAKAIHRAASMLGPGDILLIELHQPGPAFGFQERDDQRGYIPVEWWPCHMAAIQYAHSRGVIVVEAGGNGEQNLDNRIYDTNPSPPYGPFPNWWRNPFRRSPIDTGAILVGAGAPPADTEGSLYGPDRSRLQFSNFGNAIDTQGWGEKVTTCGGNNDLTPEIPSEDRQYTRGFRGTSSASAMVAGALACLQGVMRARGKNVTPRELRKLLRDDKFGSMQQAGDFAPVSQRIGPRPDLRKLIYHLAPPSCLERFLAVALGIAGK